MYLMVATFRTSKRVTQAWYWKLASELIFQGNVMALIFLQNLECEVNTSDELFFRR